MTRAEEQKVLLEITSDIARINRLDVLLKLIVDKIKPLFNFHDCGLFVISKDGQYHTDLAAVLPGVSESEWNHHIAEISLEIEHKDSALEWMIAQLHQTNQPLLLDFKDLVKRFPNYPQFLGTDILEMGYRDCLASELAMGGKTIGMFCINALSKDFFPKKQFNLFKAISGTIAIAIANIQANDEIEERDRDKNVLLSVGKKVTESKNIEDLLQIITTDLSSVLNFGEAGILVIQDELGGFFDVSTLSSENESSYETNFLKQNRSFIADVTPLKNSSISWLLKKMQNNEGSVVLSFLDDVGRFSDAACLHYLRDCGYTRSLTYPLRQNGKILAILFLNYSAQVDIPFHKEQFLQSAANQIASGLKNILDKDEIVRRENEKSKLLEISQAIASVQNNEQLLNVILNKIKPVFFYESAGLYVFERGSDIFYEITNYNVLPDAIQFELHDKNLLGPFHLNDFTEGSWLLFNEPKLTSIQEQWNYTKSTKAKEQYVIGHRNGLKQMICGPLKCAGKKIGMICFGVKRDNFYAKNDFSLFKSISDLISVAVANIQANEEILARDKEKNQLLRISEACANMRDRNELWHFIIHSLKPLLGFKIAVTTLYSADLSKYCYYLYSRQIDESISSSKKILNGYHPIVGTSDEWVLNQGDICALTTEEKEKVAGGIPETVKILKAHGIEYNLYIKLKSGGKVFGVQHFHFDDKNLVTDKTIAFAKSVTDLIASSVANILANEEIQNQMVEIKTLKEQLEIENLYLQQEVKSVYNFDEIIGQSDVLHEAFEKTHMVAATDASVLLLGETGTGKELFARAIHNNSARSSKPLIKINCAALPPQLIESELFGHERGSFTGAFDKRIGKFELAHQSTLFLDEIGEMPLDLQSKLLRVLQEKEIERLGSNKVIKTDVRIIAATNRDLLSEVEAGRFRADLFFRLNVFPIHLPALRDRQEDIELLAHYFIDRFSKKLGKQIKGISKMALESLKIHPFPGNIRELEHIIERSCILASSPIIKEVFLPKSKGKGLNGDVHFKTYRENEKEYIQLVLQKCKGKIFGTNGAAKLLDMPPTTLIGKMKKLGIKKYKVLS